MYTQDNNSIPVWFILSPAYNHISINSQPILVGIVSINSLTVFVPRDILDFYFSERRVPEGITLRPDDLRSGNIQARRSTYGRRMHQVFNAFQAVHHEIPTLEAREVTKLHYRDSKLSNDEFSSYAQSIKLLFTSSTTHLVTNETLDLYSDGATLDKCIHEGRPTTKKRTFVALLSLTSHSTFYECSRSILCQPQHPPHSPLTRLGVSISYSLHLEKNHITTDIHYFALRLLGPK